MRIRTRVVGALRRSPLRGSVDWLLLHALPGARERRSNYAIDAETVRLIESVLPADGCAVDIGAHTGAILSHIVRVAPGGSHHAVEPLPDLAAQLRSRFAAVQVHECVLGSEEWVAAAGGMAEINRNVDDPGYSSVTRADHPRVRGKTIVRTSVSASTLDRELDGATRVDLVKIDVEGFELEVLRGALRTLSAHRPVIVFEHEQIGSGADQTDSLFTLLQAADYAVQRLVDWRGSEFLGREQFVAAYGQGDSYFVARPA